MFIHHPEETTCSLVTNTSATQICWYISLLGVFKYLTIAYNYNNHPVKKICIVINYCAHIRHT